MVSFMMKVVENEEEEEEESKVKSFEKKNEETRL